MTCVFYLLSHNVFILFYARIMLCWLFIFYLLSRSVFIIILCMHCVVLQLASRYNNPEIVKLLVEIGQADMQSRATKTGKILTRF